MTDLEQWLSENKWLTLTDHFLGHRPKPNDLNTFTGLCAEIDLVWDEILHNQDMMEHYIDKCDLQNILYTKHVINTLKTRLNKLSIKFKYKSKVFMEKRTTDISELITRAKEYPMQSILERYGCTVRHNRCACPIHQGKNPTSFAIKNNQGICHCGWHGDSIALYQELFKVDFVTAVKELQ